MTASIAAALSDVNGVVLARANSSLDGRPRIIGANSGNNVVSSSDVKTTALLVEGVGVGKNVGSEGGSALVDLVLGRNDFGAEREGSADLPPGHLAAALVKPRVTRAGPLRGVGLVAHALGAVTAVAEATSAEEVVGHRDVLGEGRLSVVFGQQVIAHEGAAAVLNHSSALVSEGEGHIALGEVVGDLEELVNGGASDGVVVEAIELVVCVLDGLVALDVEHLGDVVVVLVEVECGVDDTRGRPRAVDLVGVRLAHPSRQSAGVAAADGDPSESALREFHDISFELLDEVGEIAQGDVDGESRHQQILVGQIGGKGLAVPSVFEGNHNSAHFDTPLTSVASQRRSARTFAGNVNDGELLFGSCRVPACIIDEIALEESRSGLAGVKRLREPVFGCVGFSKTEVAVELFLLSDDFSPESTTAMMLADVFFLSKTNRNGCDEKDKSREESKTQHFYIFLFFQYFFFFFLNEGNTFFFCLLMIIFLEIFFQ